LNNNVFNEFSGYIFDTIIAAVLDEWVFGRMLCCTAYSLVFAVFHLRSFVKSSIITVFNDLWDRELLSRHITVNK